MRREVCLERSVRLWVATSQRGQERGSTGARFGIRLVPERVEEGDLCESEGEKAIGAHSCHAFSDS